MNRPNDIDNNAPVVSHETMTIAAPLATAWALQCDVNTWTSWNPDVTEARMDGQFGVGTSFDWTSHGFPVTSTIYAVDDHHRILWGGTAGDITGIHDWVFEETASGLTVTTSESFSGRPVDADVASMQAMLDGSLRAWLSHLKRAAELASDTTAHIRARSAPIKELS